MMLNRVSLNTIGLNRIGLNRIGKPSRGSSDRPYIDPEVLASLKAVCICYGKSNDDPDRAIVKNLVDPDNPFVISNAAFTEGSGYADKGSPYYGAFVTDGIDDLITSTKTAEEMGITDEVTVVSMIHQINANKNFTTTNNLRNENRVIGRNTVTNIGKTGIYGWYKKDIQGTTATLIDNILGDKNDYTGHYTESTNSVANSKFYVTGYAVENGFTELSSVAWYWNFISNKYLTTDQINQVIAYFNLDRTLKPDILCDVKKQGITNENHAEFGDKLIDYSGNGRDIQLNNIAWKGDSGIGKYVEDFTTWYGATGVLQTFSKIEVTDGFKHNWVINRRSGESAINSFKVLIKGIPENGYIQYRYFESEDATKKSSIDIYEDGEYSLPNSTLNNLNDLVGFQLFAKIPPLDSQSFIGLTITQIPSHAGALCLDGINDFGKVTGMPVYKDYTFIADRYINNNVGSVASKSTDSNQYGAFIFEIGRSNYSFNVNSTVATNFNKDRTISYLSKYSYNGENVNVGNEKDSDLLWIGTIRDNETRFSSISIYSLMSFPYSMSEFLIERQLKKHKLGTLYPNMVEFRPIIKQDDRIKNVKYYKLNETADYIDLNIGDYIPVGQRIAIVVDLEEPYKITSITSSSLTDVEIRKAGGQNYAYDILGYVTDKSPQKITMDIQVDSSLVQLNPVVESNAEYQLVDFYINTYPAVVGNYYPINSKLRIAVTTKGAADEVTSLTVNGVSLGTPSIKGNSFTFNGTLPDKSPQNINIAIDEYIRFEDIVQPYPVLLRFNDENGNEVSWGGKFRVGSTITRIGSFYENNLIDGLYIVRNPKLNGNNLITPTHVVEKSMVFTCDTEYLLDNNEPKCILSPSRLRIPNSSYKILGHIPDISGHGNHGVINNSAYAERSGVNEDGSYQFDGVDDFVTIPTVTGGGKQVLMKVNLPRLNEIIYDQRKETNTYTFAILTTSSQIAYDQRNSERITYIDGILNTNIIAEQLMGVTHNIVVINSKANLDNTRSPILGRDINGNNWSRMCIYDFMLFDNISTDDKIKELNEYIGIEAKVELPPYYWDAYGKTNLDVDKATIQQRGVAVGDYDLTNTNFAYTEESGYANNGLVYDGVTDFSENVYIPAFTDYTYVFKRELLNLDKVGGGASLYKGSFYSNGGRAFIVDINDKNPNSEMSGYSYGNRASTSTLKTNKIIYGTKTSINGVSVTPGSNTDNASLTLGKWDVNYKQMVFYKLILYPKTIPLLQINFLKNLMERDEIIDLNNKIFIQE